MTDDVRLVKGFFAEKPLLADEGFPTKELPPGYEFSVQEPQFDPKIHLQLEAPERIFTMEQLGYKESIRARFPSPNALTSPARVLSKEGVATLKNISEQLLPFVWYRDNRARVPAVLRGTNFRSRFIRDLCLSQDVSNFFSDLFHTPLMPHTVGHNQGHMNFSPKDLSASVDSWHHDSTAFDYVLMVHNPRELEGGRFEVFLGTCAEGARLVKETGDLPRDRVYAPDYPDAGYACFMQGAAVFHRATRLLKQGFRNSLVQSYVTRDVRYPDTNRFYYTEAEQNAEPNAKFESDVAEVEWVRHRAWLARAKLNWIINDMPYGEGTERVIEHLEAALFDVTDFLKTVKAGRLKAEQAEALRDRLDALQID